MERSKEWALIPSDPAVQEVCTIVLHSRLKMSFASEVFATSPGFVLCRVINCKNYSDIVQYKNMPLQFWSALEMFKQWHQNSQGPYKMGSIYKTSGNPYTSRNRLERGASSVFLHWLMITWRSDKWRSGIQSIHMATLALFWLWLSTQLGPTLSAPSPTEEWEYLAKLRTVVVKEDCVNVERWCAEVMKCFFFFFFCCFLGPQPRCMEVHRLGV